MNGIAPRVQSPACPHAAVRFLVRFALMALLWLGLTGADWSSWVVGGPVVLAAAWISLKLLPAIPWHWSPWGAISFTVFFMRESLRGGWDVAWRALSPKLDLAPGILCIPFYLPPGASRLFFCSAISLLPGTSVIAIEEKNVCIHALDLSPRVEQELRELERRVAMLFGLTPGAPKEVGL